MQKLQSKQLTCRPEDKSCDERLRELNLYSLKQCMLRGYYQFSTVYKCPQSDSLHDKRDSFTVSRNDRQRTMS